MAGEHPPDVPRRGYLSLLRRNGNFRRLYVATLISLAGDWFLTVALLDLVLELSGSAALASLIIVSQSLPIFLSTPISGHLVDRLDRKLLMIWMDILRVFACLLPLMSHSRATLGFAFAGVIVISLGSSVFEPAAAAALPNLVDNEDLSAANVLFGSTWGTMLAVGAAIGGAVTAQFGRNVSFISDAVSFGISAVLIYSISGKFAEERKHEHPPPIRSVRETFQYAKKHRRVLALLVSKGGYGIGAGVVAMLSVFGREVFKAGAFGIGLLFAARGVGALLGPFIARGVSRTNDEQYRLISWSVLIFGLGYVGLAFSTVLTIGALSIAIAHLGGGAQWQTSTFGLQNEVDDYIRGRVFAVDYGLVTLTMSISSVITGVIADHIGAVRATAITASLCVLWALAWGISTRKLWRPLEASYATQKN